MNLSQHLSQVDWSGQRRALPRATRWISPYLSGRKIEKVAEWGSGFGELRHAVKTPVEYQGFETSQALVDNAKAQGLSIYRHDPAYPLPLETASQDLFLAVDFLEYLRMDQAYMVISEARRVLRPGGLCVLKSLSFAPRILGHLVGKQWLKIYERHPSWVRGRRPLELTHYISPEDWRVLHDSHEPASWISSQRLVLERL